MAYGQLKQVDYKNLTVSNVVHGLKHVGQECRKQAVWLLTPDGIKKATATATNLYAQFRATKLLGSIYQRVFQHTHDALSKLRECVQPENVVQLADGTKMSVPASDMQTLYSESQPVSPKRSGGLLGTLHDNTVLFSIDLPKNCKGIIKKFDIIEKMRKHIFSVDHIKAGIKNLGGNENAILQKIANEIVKFDQQGTVREGANYFVVFIDGYETTIRCFVSDGAVKMMNAFIGKSAR